MKFVRIYFGISVHHNFTQAISRSAVPKQAPNDLEVHVGY